MSDLKSKQFAAGLLRDTLAKKPRPSYWHLLIGVIYPAAVVVFEFATHWCAQNLFDPLPTNWHTLSVLAVPASNLVLWNALRHGSNLNPKWLTLMSGISIGIAAFYALIFLPLLPLAIVAILLYGIGFLPMAPLASLISAITLAGAFRRKQPGSYGRHLAGGAAAGLALLVLLDVPSAATRLGVQWSASSDAAERERGISLLRAFGDDDLLLRLCYDAIGRPSGLLSGLVMFGNRSFLKPQQRQFSQSTSEVREIYYRVHGIPFNAKPAPFAKGAWTRFGDFQFDADHGGTEVGGRIKGLDLVSSRIDGSISASDAVGYLEWIVEFRNTSPTAREARVQFALPPGGAVSRAVLWINGEEREAAFGSRAAVREAYQKVAVQQRRDPLLVTTKGADRVLAQAFPVPGNGGTLKFKLGITAPLDLQAPGKAGLVLPAIVDRNFSFATNFEHNIWLESKTPLSAAAAGLTASEVSPGLHRLQGSLSDTALARVRPAISVVRAGDPGPVATPAIDGKSIVQRLAETGTEVPKALVIVIDGSARLAGQTSTIIAALDKIPAGTPTALLIAAEPARSLDIAPWSQPQKEAAIKLVTAASFSGGQDNTRALAKALLTLETTDNGALLWIHGPQPITFRDTAGLLEQTASRLARRPQVWLYATEPGPNELLPDLPWAWSARSIPQTRSLEDGLAAFFTTTFTPHQITSVRREQTTAPAPDQPHMTEGSSHIARLWARDRVLELMSTNSERNHEQAVALANQYHVVTPVNGAVVLETQKQFDDSHLTPVTKASVPTVPEPEEWALLLIALAAFIWLMRQQRNARAMA